jgi:hypothetical protein
MSQLGKILLYVAVAGGLVDIYAAFASYQKFGQDKATITTVQQDRDAAKTKLTAETKAADDAQAAQAAAESSLKEAQAKYDEMKSNLATDEQTLTDTKTALAQAKQAQQDAQTKLDQLNTALNGQTPDQLNAQIKKAADDLAASQSEQKILQDQAQATQAQIAQLQDAINRSKTGNIPPGISGKVTFVNRAWNFVVLNVGLSNGVVPNGELIIYRGRDFLGKVKVTSAESNSAVADILPDAKADIQVGDDVLN